LQVRPWGEPGNSLDLVFIKPTYIRINFPWTYLQFTDPSLLLVMHDDRSTPEREEMVSDGIMISLAMGEKLLESQTPCLWEPWDIFGNYTEHLKKSYYIMKDGLRSIPQQP
jgi:hypothetical protein